MLKFIYPFLYMKISCLCFIMFHFFRSNQHFALRFMASFLLICTTRGNQKKCPDFGKKCPDSVHPLLKFVIQNVVLRVSKRKNSEIFLCGAFFLDFLIKCLSKCSNFTKPPLPWEISGCAPVIQR